MLLEIRTYTLHPGRRDEFVEFFETEVIPAMQAVGMTIVGPFVSDDDPDLFVYLRPFVDDAQRTALSKAFYESDVWLGGMKERALALEQGYEVVVVTSTAGATWPAGVGQVD